MQQLTDKVAIVHGGGGAIGGTVARAFAAEGAVVHLAGRTPESLDVVAKDIAAAGGTAHVARLDVLDEDAVGAHADAVVAASGRIDVVVNAVGFLHVQGTPLADLSLDDFTAPIAAYTRAHFLVARAAARHMTARGAGVYLGVSTPGARMAGPGILGFGVACAAIEAFTRLLAAELGPSGVRALCLRPDALPEALALGSHSREVFAPGAAAMGLTVDAMAEQMLAGPVEHTLLKRFPRLDEVAGAAVFAASDRGGAMTGTVINLTCGGLVD
jgi:3-oxoacyl-[acyl-carrier protein] reductase